MVNLTSHGFWPAGLPTTCGGDSACSLEGRTINEVAKTAFTVPLGTLFVVLLTGCVASQTQQPTTMLPAIDRLLTLGDIQVAQEHLRAFGFNPWPVTGIFPAETQAAVRAYQAREGLPVTGLLDRATRRELLPGFDSDRRF